MENITLRVSMVSPTGTENLLCLAPYLNVNELTPGTKHIFDGNSNPAKTGYLSCGYFYKELGNHYLVFDLRSYQFLETDVQNSSNESVSTFSQPIVTFGVSYYVNGVQTSDSSSQLFSVKSATELKSLNFETQQNTSNQRMEWLTKVMGLFTIVIGSLELFRWRKERLGPLQSAILTVSDNLSRMRIYYSDARKGDETAVQIFSPQKLEASSISALRGEFLFDQKDEAELDQAIEVFSVHNSSIELFRKIPVTRNALYEMKTNLLPKIESTEKKLKEKYGREQLFTKLLAGAFIIVVLGILLV